MLSPRGIERGATAIDDEICSNEIEFRRLFQSELGSSPMSPLEVVFDVVVGFHSDPVGHLPVLLDLLAESLLKLVTLVGSLISLPLLLTDFINLASR